MPLSKFIEIVMREGTYLPVSVEPQLNTIWAMTDFTEENASPPTACPGSHRLALGAKGDTRANMSSGNDQGLRYCSIRVVSCITVVPIGQERRGWA